MATGVPGLAHGMLIAAGDFEGAPCCLALQIAQVAVFRILQAQLERAHLDDVAVPDALPDRLQPVDRDAVLRIEIADHDAVLSRG